MTEFNHPARVKRIICLLLTAVLLLAHPAALAADPVAVAAITLNETAVSLPLGKSVSLKAAAEPKNASNKKIVWSSSDEGVATVKNGKVTAAGIGRATVTAAAEDGGGAAAAVEVTVFAPVKKITLSEAKPFSLPPFVPWRITALAEPSDATDLSVKWSSSDEKVAAVDDRGVVTGIAPGKANIVAEAADGGGARAKVTVQIKKYDLVFTDSDPQTVHYTYNPGIRHITTHVKNGCVRPSLREAAVMMAGGPQTESFTVTPLKAGEDELTVRITGQGNTVFRIFVSPEVFSGSAAASPEIREGESGPEEILFLDIPWGASYPEAKKVLGEKNISLKKPAQRNDFIRASVSGEVDFSNLKAENTALDFSYTQGDTGYMENNTLIKGTFYFDDSIPFEQVHLAVRNVYGLDKGDLEEGECTWQAGGAVLRLEKKERNTVLVITPAQ